MIELPLPILAAERKAKEILAQYAIDAPEYIRVRDLAFDLGVGVVEGPLHGAAARLVRSGEVAVIIVICIVVCAQAKYGMALLREAGLP